jgi:hypothetical protein
MLSPGEGSAFLFNGITKIIGKANKSRFFVAMLLRMT